MSLGNDLRWSPECLLSDSIHPLVSLPSRFIIGKDPVSIFVDKKLAADEQEIGYGGAYL